MEAIMAPGIESPVIVSSKKADATIHR